VRQSRATSAMEAVANVAVGWLVAFAMQLLLFPAVGVQASVSQNLVVSLVFTAVSLIRSYILRRFFALREAV